MAVFQSPVRIHRVDIAQRRSLVTSQGGLVKVSRPDPTFTFGPNGSMGFHTISFAAYQILFRELHKNQKALTGDFHRFWQAMVEICQDTLGRADSRSLSWRNEVEGLGVHLQKSFTAFTTSPTEKNGEVYLSDLLRLIHYFPFAVIPTDNAKDDRGPDVREGKEILDSAFATGDEQDLTQGLVDSLDDIVAEAHQFYRDTASFFAGLNGLVYAVSYPWFQRYQPQRVQSCRKFLESEKRLLEMVVAPYAPRGVFQQALERLKQEV